MEEINKIIDQLFKDRWYGYLADADIEEKRAQLYKTLKNQTDGYWSGHTAYHLVVEGGFLIDAKSNTSKKLTALGEFFMNDYKNRIN
ncbi:MAG: hypothetical protein GY941_26320 [Planctomycetes bacterium]|nr:hypothetical protein [Planctomycetota bacterium]